MDSGLSKIGASLLAVFGLCLVILAADVAYVIWRRRRFHRRSSAAVVTGESSIYVLSSKELLYFLCWKNQSRIEPSVEQTRQVNQVSASSGEVGDHQESEDEVVLKLQQEMYGRRRLLFTIKEEEENNTADQRSVISDGQDQEFVNDVEVPAVTLTVEDDDDDNSATPFSTPCASPPYLTPSPSPSRDEVKRSHGSYGEVQQFVSLEIVGL